MPDKRPGKNGGTLTTQAKGEPSLNPKGRGKGVLNSKTIINRWLAATEKGKHPITGKMMKLSQLDIITLKQLEKARKGDTMAFRELLDRSEGKVTQANTISNPDGSNLIPELNIIIDGSPFKLATSEDEVDLESKAQS